MSVAVTVVAPRRGAPSNDDIAETSAPRVHDEHRNRGESEKAETGTARRNSAKVVGAHLGRRRLRVGPGAVNWELWLEL